MERIKGLGALDILVVVFLLGIVVAIVVPRFMNLHSDAHRANNQGTAAALSAGVALLHSKATQQGNNNPLEIQIAGEKNVILLTDNGFPQGHGKALTNYRLFEQSPLGDEACKAFFKIVMHGKNSTVVTREDYLKRGQKGDYIAIGFKGRIYDGCRYVYTEGQPEKGKVYTVTYDPNDGAVAVGVGDMPK